MENLSFLVSQPLHPSPSTPPYSSSLLNQPMKIHTYLPWFTPILRWKFPSADMSRVVIAYGDDVYSQIQFIEPAVLHHESIHLNQQGHSKVKGTIWWVLYLLSKRFRFEMELEAYQEQYQWVLRNEPMNHEYWLNKESLDFSSDAYRFGISYETARKLICS